MRKVQMFLLLIISSSFLYAIDYYVSPLGLDSNPGTLKEPFQTINKASQVIEPGDTCFLREGTYREILRPGTSGLPDKEIIYTGYKNEKVKLSALEPISGWEKGIAGIYTAPMEWTLDDRNQFFSNDEMLNEASWPNPGSKPLFNPIRAKVLIGEEHTLINPDIPGDKNDWIGAELWCKGGAGWISWTGKVTDFDPEKKKLSFKMPGYSDKFYIPRKNNEFVLRGALKALDSPGEWLYDSANKKILIIPPKDTNIYNLHIEAKKRPTVIDLEDRSYITIKKIEFIGGDIITNGNSSHITLDKLKGRYISHSYEEGDTWNSGIKIYGNNNLVMNCDFGYSSGSVLMVKGYKNRIINNYLHHGDYSGMWVGAVDLKGRKQLFSHNTVTYSGRDILTVSELMESIVQYNDLSHSGYLTNDLGLVYANNTDFANTIFQYNWLHDNKAQQIAPGFHIDIANYNVILKNNVVWNVPDAPISINHPSQNSIVFNNSSLNSGAVTTFGWFESTKQISSRYFNNIFNDEMRVNVYKRNNLIRKRPSYRNPEDGDFRLKGKNKVGAYANSEKLWKPGFNLNNPPDPLPKYSAPNIPWMNKIYNASFEFGTTEGWIKTGSKQAKLIEGNTWGNNWGSEDLHRTGTNKFELELGSGPDGIEQTIKNLSPNTKYTLSGWLRCSDSENKITLGVKNYGGKDTRKSSISKKWKRKVIKFTTGPNSTEATIYIIKADSNGKAWCDNLLLPLTSK